jgi:hypothetical protein
MNYNLLCISDIHLGNKRNSALSIIESLDFYINDKLIQDHAIKLLVIAGDLFDGILDLPDSDVGYILSWMKRLLLVAQRNKVILRVLEGTPSHDREQSKLFEKLVDIDSMTLNFKYVNTLSVEYIEDLNSNILYVPDEWGIDNQNTFEEVKIILKNKGLDKVNLAFMHGQFKHQLPSNIGSIPFHDSDNYLPIVYNGIFIGHVHTFSVFDKIIAQGSFDRLTHGQEEPKGFIIAGVSTEVEGLIYYHFIENKKAKKYITIECSDLSIEDCLKKIDLAVDNIPDDSHVRIKANADHPIFTNMNELIKRYLTIHFKRQPIAKEQETLAKNLKIQEHYKPFEITPTNIITLVEKSPFIETIGDKKLQSFIMSKLREFVNE